MKITLIYVGIFEGNNVVPPLGIMYIGAVLEKAGYEVQLFDVDPFVEDCVNGIKRFGPRMIGVGFLTSAYPRAFKLIQNLKKEIPEAIYFCGGVHTTCLPVQVLEAFGVDFVVVGEGEYTTLEACKRIEAGGGLEDVKGIVHKKGKEVITAPPRPVIENLNELPLPARNLVDFEKRYLTFPGVIRGKWVRSTIIIAGRGCPYNCSYCAVRTIFGRKYRLRSIEGVISEIESLRKNYNIKGFYFNDSAFTVNKKWIIEFSKALRKKNIQLPWGCNSRVDTVSQEMLEEMKKAGCMQFDFGVESGSDKILKVLNKKVTTHQIREAFRITKKVGMRTGAYFMIGNPEETLEDANETLQMAKDISSNYTVFFFTTPFPGTELYEQAVEHGWISRDMDFNEVWAFRESDYPLMNINFSKEELKDLRARFQNHFFFRNYINFHNLKIMVSLLWLALSNLNITWRIMVKTVKLKRLDTLVENFLTQYRLKIIRSGNKGIHS
jgi:radical SAM superfamily enzyme YgiQ (UPF0313 family)